MGTYPWNALVEVAGGEIVAVVADREDDFPEMTQDDSSGAAEIRWYCCRLDEALADLQRPGACAFLVMTRRNGSDGEGHSFVVPSSASSDAPAL